MQKIAMTLLAFLAIRGAATALVEIGLASSRFVVFALIGYMWAAAFSYSLGNWLTEKLRRRSQ